MKNLRGFKVTTLQATDTKPMIKQILNPWNNPKNEKRYFYESTPVYSNGDYHIYRQNSNCYLYAYKNMAFNQLAGLNKDHLNNVAERKRPENGFLYDLAIESLNKCEQIDSKV